MSCATRYRQLAAFMEKQTGVPAGVCPLARTVTPGANNIIHRLHQAGYQTVVVGGAVRDALSGKEPHDIDLATSATPEQIKRVFPGQTRDAGGEQFGTVLVVQAGESPTEVTTYREDVETDGKHAKVKYTDDPVKDLERRDFYVNALSYDPVSGRLYGPGGDPSMAIDDLVNRRVRFVGDGLTRLAENQPRALRLPRFVAKLEGEADPAAMEAVREAIRRGILPGKISWEGVHKELIKTLDYPQGVRGLRLWQDLGLMQMFVPEVANCAGQKQNVYHGDVDVLEHQFRAAEAVDPNHPGIGKFKDDEGGSALGKFRLTMLLHDIGKPATAEYRGDDYGYQFLEHDKVGAEMADDLCRRLKLDNDTREAVKLAVREHMAIPKPDASEKSIRRWARRVGYENVEFLLAVREADWGAGGRGKGEEARQGSTRIRQVLGEAQNAAPVVKLAVNGHDVMQALGLTKRDGLKVGQVLRDLEGVIDDNPALNQRETLLEMLEETYAN